MLEYAVAGSPRLQVSPKRHQIPEPAEGLGPGYQETKPRDDLTRMLVGPMYAFDADGGYADLKPYSIKTDSDGELVLEPGKIGVRPDGLLIRVIDDDIYRLSSVEAGVVQNIGEMVKVIWIKEAVCNEVAARQSARQLLNGAEFSRQTYLN